MNKNNNRAMLLLCTCAVCTSVAADPATWVELEVARSHVRLLEQSWMDIPLKTSRLKQQAQAQGKVLTAQTPWAVQVLDADDQVIDEIEINDPLLLYSEVIDEPSTSTDGPARLEYPEREELVLEHGVVGLLVPHADAAYRLRVIQRPVEGQASAVVSGEVTLRRMP